MLTNGAMYIDPHQLSNQRLRRICGWIIVGTVLLGAVGRLKHYAARPSYWNDEAAAVINIIQRDWRHLLDRLDYAQAAPPLFLWSERAMYLWLGPGEYGLRFIPMLCGLAVLPLYARLAWRTLSPRSACWTVAWFTFFQKLLHRANDVKQYSGDLLFSVLLLLTVFGPKAETSASRRMLILSLTATVALWFSFPVPFLFGALSLVLLPGCFRAGARGRVIWFLCNTMVLLSFLGLSRVTLSQGGNSSLLEFWTASFPDFHHPARIPLWFMGEVYGLFGYPFDAFGAITTLLAVLGIVALLRQKAPSSTGNFSRNIPTVLLLALGLAFVAAALHRYPFPGRHRLGLYLIPITLLILGAGADAESVGATIGFRRWWYVLTVPLLLLEAGQFMKDLFTLREESTTRPVVEYVRAHRRTEEPIYLCGNSLAVGPASGRSAEFLCYWPDVPGKVGIGFTDPTEIREERFWAVYSLNRPETKSPTYPEQLLRLMGKDARVIDSCQPGGQSGAMLIERRGFNK